MPASNSILLRSICLFISCMLLVSCGIKNDPKPPERILIPPVSDVRATLSDQSVLLSWTPSLRYNDNSQLELRAVEIWQLDESLDKRLEEYRNRQAILAEERAKAGLEITPDPNLSSISPLSARLEELGQINPERFERNGRVVDSIPIEQLIDMTHGGRAYWSHQRPAPAVEIPNSRSVYAIREVDSDGKRSAFSNMVSIYPLFVPSSPKDLTYGLSQTQLSLLWNSPDRPEKSLDMALIGYNVYVSNEDGAFTPNPANAAPIPFATPQEWNPYNLASAQRIDGVNSRYALLLNTMPLDEPSGLMQTIYSPDDISAHIGEEVTVTLSMRTRSGSGIAQIVMDASRDPSLETSIPVGQDIFRQEEDNPLIQVEKFSISEELKIYTFTAKVPVGAVAYFLRIEPRGKSPVASAYIIESVSVMAAGSDEELIENGDFSQFSPLSYIEDIQSFGLKKRYRVSALYSIGPMTIESAPAETEEILIEDTFPPDPPRSVRAQATFNSVTITWNRSRASDFSGYHVFRQDPGDARWKRLTGHPIPRTLYRDDDVEAGKTYNYRVESVDNAGNMSASDEVVSAKVLSQN